MPIHRQAIGNRHLRYRILHRTRFDDRIVPIRIAHEHHPLVLLLRRGPALPPLPLLRLPRQLRLLLLPPALQLRLRHLGHGDGHAAGLLVRLPHRLLQVLLLLLGQPARLGLAGEGLGALLGLLLALLGGAGLGALGVAPVPLLLLAVLPRLALGLRGGLPSPGLLGLAVDAHLLRHVCGGVWIVDLCGGGDRDSDRRFPRGRFGSSGEDRGFFGRSELKWIEFEVKLPETENRLRVSIPSDDPVRPDAECAPIGITITSITDVRFLGLKK